MSYFELGLDNAEHGGELRKEEHAAALSEEGFEELEEVFEFGRAFGLLRFAGRKFEKRGMTADLAKLEEGIEDGEL